MRCRRKPTHLSWRSSGYLHCHCLSKLTWGCFVGSFENQLGCFFSHHARAGLGCPLPPPHTPTWLRRESCIWKAPPWPPLPEWLLPRASPVGSREDKEHEEGKERKTEFKRGGGKKKKRDAMKHAHALPYFFKDQGYLLPYWSFFLLWAQCSTLHCAGGRVW